LDHPGSGVSDHSNTSPCLEPGFTHDTRAFIPFSFGPSICVGKALAYQEMRIVVCMLIRAFDMQFAPAYDPSQWEEDLQDFMVIGTGKLPVVLKRRDPQLSGRVY
jgi:cytochrome P450